jgi:hypothetical protein
MFFTHSKWCVAMSDLDDKRNQFEQRLQDLQNQRQQTPSSSQSSRTSASEAASLLEQRFQEWGTRLDTHLVEYQQQLVQAEQALKTPARPTSIAAIGSVSIQCSDPDLRSWLEALDAMMFSELHLKQLPCPPGIQNLVVVNSAREVGQLFCQGLGVNRRVTLSAAATEAPPVMHLPGKGTFINADYYRRRFNTGILGQIGVKERAILMQELACERWGWGYLIENTTLGQQAGKAGLWPALIAQRFGQRAPAAADEQTAAALQQAWNFTQHGWEDWVAQYITCKAHSPLGREYYGRPDPKTRLSQLSAIGNFVGEQLSDLELKIPLSGGAITLPMKNIIQVVKYLVDEFLADPRGLNQLVLALQRVAPQIDQAIDDSLLVNLSFLLGQLHFVNLEASLGILPVPFAMQIVCHNQALQLDSLASAEAVLEAVSANPLSNPDTRLALLCRIDPRARYDPQVMFTAAREQLGLEGPTEIS